MASIKMKEHAGKEEDRTGSYVVSVQAARFYRQTRYYWTICRAEKPEEMVSWGNAPSKEEAEAAARSEIADLLTGFSDGGARTPRFMSHRQ